MTRASRAGFAQKPLARVMDGVRESSTTRKRRGIVNYRNAVPDRDPRACHRRTQSLPIETSYQRREISGKKLPSVNAEPKERRAALRASIPILRSA
jgi:hypothetical protein